MTVLPDDPRLDPKRARKRAIKGLRVKGSALGVHGRHAFHPLTVTDKSQVGTDHAPDFEERLREEVGVTWFTGSDDDKRVVLDSFQSNARVILRPSGDLDVDFVNYMNSAKTKMNPRDIFESLGFDPDTARLGTFSNVPDEKLEQWLKYWKKGPREPGKHADWEVKKIEFELDARAFSTQRQNPLADADTFQVMTWLAYWDSAAGRRDDYPKSIVEKEKLRDELDRRALEDPVIQSVRQRLTDDAPELLYLPSLLRDQVTWSYTERAEAMKGRASPLVRRIEINTHTADWVLDTHHLTGAHEMGHLIDFYGALEDQDKRGFFFSEEDHPLLDDLWRAVTRSGHIKRLNDMVQTHDRKHVDYLAQRREIWARAFAQWFAIRSRETHLLEELDAMRDSPYGVQWTDEEFVEIAEVMDRIMGQLRDDERRNPS